MKSGEYLREWEEEKRKEPDKGDQKGRTKGQEDARHEQWDTQDLPRALGGTTETESVHLFFLHLALLPNCYYRRHREHARDQDDCSR